MPRKSASKTPASKQALPQAVVVKNLAQLAKSETEASIARLVALRDDPTQPGFVQLQASNALLDRGHGKPVATIQQRIIRTLADLTNDEIRALMQDPAVLDGLVEDIVMPDRDALN